MGRCARSLALVSLLVAGWQAFPEDAPHLSLVPWKVLGPGEAIDAPLVLLWIPASRDEVRRSPLLTSETLRSLSTRCVAMRVVRSDDGERLAALKIEATLPLAVLVDAEGAVVGTVESDHGLLPLSEVEDLVRDQVDARVSAAERNLDAARHFESDGDIERAIEAYRLVWEDRCLCPRQARAAQKAIKRLSR